MAKDVEWRPVQGREGEYEVSNTGLVAKLYIDKDYTIQRKLLALSTGRNGYIYSIQYLVHRLVAKAFLLNPEGYGEVHHIDNDKTNNHVSNLEWCTRSHNNRKKYMGKRRGVRWRASKKKWQAEIKVGKKYTYLGIYSDPEEAYEAYRQAYINAYNEEPW